MDILKAIEENDIEQVKLWLKSNSLKEESLTRKERGDLLASSIQKGKLEIVKLLLEDKNIVNSDLSGETPLICAVNNNQEEIVNYMLSIKADINLDVNNAGGTDNTPLHLAVQNKNENISLSLLQNGANVRSATKQNGYTPLHDATWLGNLKICTMLISHGADVNSTSKYDTTPLYNAVKKGNLDVCILLIEKNANLDHQSNVGSTALHEAVMKGHHDICKLLVNSGANVNLPNIEYGWTPLHHAAFYGYLNICQILVEANADINSVSNDGTTPLYSATQKNHFDVCSYLLMHGANVHKANNKNNTPLHSASLNDYYDLCKLLIDNGANVNALNVYDETPLHAAVKMDFKERKLNPNNYYNYASCNLQVNNGSVASHDSDEILKLLLDNGSNINAVDADGNSAAHIAASRKNLSNLEILLHNKIDINLKNNLNSTALDIARRNKIIK